MQRSLRLILSTFAILIANLGFAQEIHLHNTIPSTAKPKDLELRSSGKSEDGIRTFTIPRAGQREYYRLGFCGDAVAGRTQHLRVSFSFANQESAETVSYKIERRLRQHSSRDIAVRGCTNGEQAVFDIYRQVDYHKSCDAVYIEVSNLPDVLTVEIEETNGLDNRVPNTVFGWKEDCHGYSDEWSPVGTLE